MSTLRLRRCLAGFAVAALAATVAVLPASGPAAASASASACGTSSGVTVVVDFRALGGITTACAPGDPATGLAALTGAGFGVAGTTRWGLAFVCRINGLPTAATEPCNNTPPATAYWSYWHASPGGGWSYSGLGASSFDPAPGTVEGWSFGSGAPPEIAPPAPPAEPPAQAPLPPPTPPTAATPSPESTVDPSAGPSPSPSTASSSPATSSPATSSPATSITIVDLWHAAGQPTGSGGATGTLVGVGLVALIAAAAGVIGLRRRIRIRPATEPPTYPPTARDHAD